VVSSSVVPIIAMVVKKVKGAIIIGIIGDQLDVTGKLVHPAGWGLNVPKIPAQLADTSDFGLLGHFLTAGPLSPLGSFAKIGAVWAIRLVFALMLADFFDTMGTMVAIGAEAGRSTREATR
jgi:adenine/guanine/hypoxanthine permease